MQIRLFASLTILCASSLASAEPEDRHDHSRLAVTAGLFTPTGEIGIEYAQALHPNIELAAGAGVGLVRVGPQFSIMPRVRTRRGALTFSAGAGLSAGKFNNISPFQDSTAPDILSLFANGEAGVTLASRRGPFVRAFLGAGKIVAHGKNTAVDPNTRMDVDASLREVLPYGGISGGWVF